MPSFNETFSIEIFLRHPSYDPIDISHALLRQPEISWRRGDGVADRIRQSSLWRGRLWSGTGINEYEDSLKEVVSFLTKHQLFLSAFILGGGEGDVVLNHTAMSDDGKIFELYLSPAFLSALSGLAIGLRVQAWSDGSVERGSPPTPGELAEALNT